MRRRLPPWGDCVLWLFTGWLGGLAVALAAFALRSRLEGGGWVDRLISLAPNLLGIGLVLILGLAAASDSPARVLSLRLPDWRTLPGVVLASLGLTLLVAELSTWLEHWLPMPEAVEELFRQVLEYHSLAELAGVLLFLVVVAPLTEELMFRGLFLHRLQEGHGPRAAILGSALCFGIFHLLPWQAVGAALVGVYLGWLTVRCRSIVPPILSHAVFNFVPVVASGLPENAGRIRNLGASPATEDAHLPGSWLVAGAVAVVLGILLTGKAAPPSRAEPSYPASLPHPASPEPPAG